jgi:hypothetical protein
VLLKTIKGGKMDTDLYECDHSKKNRRGAFDCKAQMRIRYIDPTSQLIQTSGEHCHTRLKDDGLSTPVKQKVREMDTPLSGKTPRVMQRALHGSAPRSCAEEEDLKQLWSELTEADYYTEETFSSW